MKENGSSKTELKHTYFGKNLKFLRRMKGLTQTALAEKVGMKRNNIASYESGMVEPSISKFLEVCNFFEVTPKEMLTILMSEHVGEIIPNDGSHDSILDDYLKEKLESFIVQTNEMSKIYEGYKAFFELKKAENQNADNQDLYRTLDDLLDILRSLIVGNWGMIQSVFPDEEE